MAEQAISYVFTVLLILMVPGPDMLLVFKNAMNGGRRLAFWTAVGTLGGCALLATATVAGLAMLVQSSPVAFTALRIAGGAYLAFLGLQSLRSWLSSRRAPLGSATLPAPHHGSGTATGAIPGVITTGFPSLRGIRARSFRQGAACTMLNPKALLFYLALLPQFDFAPLDPTAQFFVKAAAHLAIAAVFYTVLVLLIGKAVQWFSTPAFRTRLDGISGVLLLLLGASVAVAV